MKQFIREINQRIQWVNLDTLARWVLEEGIRIQQIPAPTFAEDRRAQYVSDQFRNLGLKDIRIDSQKNVYGLLAGKNRQVPALLLTAHTDTVFAEETDLSVKHDGNLVYGPGLGDNSIGVSGMLGVAKWFRENIIVPDCDIWFVATSCEEGLGDLLGMRATYDALKARIGAVINLEGLAFGYVYHAGIAVHRLHITANADGGHSWLHFGRPSAIHGIIELGAQINRLNPPTSPRTTFNIGMIDGGQTINAIATKASLWLDLRSESQSALDQIRKQVYDLIANVAKPGLTFSVEVVGDRPAGALQEKHPLVQGALFALSEVYVRGTLETGSTDGNIPLYHGCPTVTVGITRGGNAHRLDEYIEIDPIKNGMKQLLMLTIAAATYQRDTHEKAVGD